MRDLRRNQSKIWYSNYTGKRPIIDPDGNETGEHELTYTDPDFFTGTVSPNKGKSATYQFGEFADYDKAITFVGKSPVSETSILWIDNLIDGVIPIDSEGNRISHDHEVKKVAESLNSTSLAVKKVV